MVKLVLDEDHPLSLSPPFSLHSRVELVFFPTKYVVAEIAVRPSIQIDTPPAGMNRAQLSTHTNSDKWPDPELVGH